jgi:hypothetical protein
MQVDVFHSPQNQAVLAEKRVFQQPRDFSPNSECKLLFAYVPTDLAVYIHADNLGVFLLCLDMANG